MVPAKKPELTQRHKDACLAFTHVHARWNNPQWRRVMFSDESTSFIYGEWTAEDEPGGGAKNDMFQLQ